MKTCIIYHSYSGVTQGIAEKIKAACGGDLIEVKPKDTYSTLSAYSVGCYRARKEACDPINPEIIDVSLYDLIVIGTPVWAWKATPVINGAIAALKGSEGKKAVIFATCGSSAKDTLPIMKSALEKKGVRVSAELVLNKSDISGNEKVNDLIALVRTAINNS
jgi:flavodoxin